MSDPDALPFIGDYIMNQLVFVLLAAVPTAWLLWRRGWIDRKRRFGLVLAIVCAVYFMIFRSLPERDQPVAAGPDNIKESTAPPAPPRYNLPARENKYPDATTFTLSRPTSHPSAK
jgi:hypothetical protein